MRLDQDQIFTFCEEPVNGESVARGRTLQDYHKLHIEGKGYDGFLKQIEGYEDTNDLKLRKQLSGAATVDIMTTVIDELSRWKNTQGTNKKYHLKDKEKENDFTQMLGGVWKETSLNDFITSFFDKALFTEFNGFVVVTKPKIKDGAAYKEGVQIPWGGDDLDPYLIFVAAEDVRDFKSTGNKVEYLIFKTGEITNDDGSKRADVLRAIDDTTDRVINFYEGKKQGEQCELVSEIENELEYVPAVQISTFKENITNDEIKDSPVAHLIPMLDRYLSKDSFQTITEIKHAFPKLAALSVECRACEGSGVAVNKNTGDQVKCTECQGRGIKVPFSHGAFMALQEVPEDTVFPPGAPASYITPDNDSVRYGKETLDELKERILFSGTGNKALVSEEISRTATESIINHRSLEDRVGDIIDNIETVETFLTDAIGKMHNSFKGAYEGCTVKYGRNLNLRDENTVLQEIKQSKDAGMPESHIENLQKELISSRYKNSPEMLNRYLLLADIEPLCGYTAKEVLDMREYLNPEILKLKVNFNERVDEFEQQNGVVTEYGADMDHDKRVVEIRTKLLEYGNDYSSGTGDGRPGQSSGQDPDNL